MCPQRINGRAKAGVPEKVAMPITGPEGQRIMLIARGPLGYARVSM
jgi:hypothetical protein